MGNDGGTIARGQDLRAVYSISNTNTNANAKEKKNLIDNLQHTLLSVCSLTSLPLYEHGQAHAVVSDFHGKLYLKEKLLELLILKRTSRSENIHKLDHIKGLGDIIDVHITWSEHGTVLCPVTKTEATKKTKFAYLRPCGCVVSSKVISDMRRHRKIADSAANTDVSDACPNCNKAFTHNYDVVMLNPESDPECEEFNSRNYAYLKDVLHVGHAKKHLKREKRRPKAEKKEKTTDGKVSKV
ncbi:hypothetical protein OXX59_002802 [Metschnikowia pulcherrima]